LKQFFDNGETELQLSSAHSQASLFHETVTECDNKCTAESALAVKTLLLKLQIRRNEHIPCIVKKLLTDLVQYSEMTMQSYSRTSKEFHDSALSYLEAWNKREDLSKFSCLLLDKVPTREYSDNVIDLLSSECEILTINPNELFDECTMYVIIAKRKQIIQFQLPL
jgi:hypothetical protein